MVLNGKAAIVTGAASGIGIADSHAQARVAIADFDLRPPMLLRRNEPRLVLALERRSRAHQPNLDEAVAMLTTSRMERQIAEATRRACMVCVATHLSLRSDEYDCLQCVTYVDERRNRLRTETHAKNAPLVCR
jgi:hypothetical protein